MANCFRPSLADEQGLRRCAISPLPPQLLLLVLAMIFDKLIQPFDSMAAMLPTDATTGSSAGKFQVVWIAVIQPLISLRHVDTASASKVPNPALVHGRGIKGRCCQSPVAGYRGVWR